MIKKINAFYTIIFNCRQAHLVNLNIPCTQYFSNINMENKVKIF